VTLDDMIRDRVSINGDFNDIAERSQALKFVLRQGKWDGMSIVNKEALEAIVEMIAEVITGDPNDAGKWNVIAVWARARAMTLEPPRKARSLGLRAVEDSLLPVPPDDAA
jgi:hypothetical protein